MEEENVTQNEVKPKRKSPITLWKIGEIVVIVTLLVAVLQVWQNWTGAKRQEGILLDLNDNSRQQVAAQQTLVALQQNSSSPQQIQDSYATTAALVNQYNIILSSLTPSMVVQTVTNIPTMTSSPTQTYTPSATETYTPIPTSTNTPLPSATPTPSLMLPFSDNFDNGLKDEWEKIKNEPTFIGGKIGRTMGELKLSIGDTTLSNYVLEFDYYNLYNCANCLFVEVLMGSKIKFLIAGFGVGGQYYKIQAFDNNNWIDLTSGGPPSPDGHVKLVVSGNTYQAYLDGTASDPIIYGSDTEKHGPIIFTLDHGMFMDNVSITSP